MKKLIDTKVKVSFEVDLKNWLPEDVDIMESPIDVMHNVIYDVFITRLMRVNRVDEMNIQIGKKGPASQKEFLLEAINAELSLYEDAAHSLSVKPCQKFELVKKDFKNG